jgi:hypothetical protein
MVGSLLIAIWVPGGNGLQTADIAVSWLTWWGTLAGLKGLRQIGCDKAIGVGRLVRAGTPVVHDVDLLQFACRIFR